MGAGIYLESFYLEGRYLETSYLIKRHFVLMFTHIFIPAYVIILPNKINQVYLNKQTITFITLGYII